jgi:hypothetical protein
VAFDPETTSNYSHSKLESHLHSRIFQQATVTCDIHASITGIASPESSGTEPVIEKSQ